MKNKILLSVFVSLLLFLQISYAQIAEDSGTLGTGNPLTGDVQLPGTVETTTTTTTTTTPAAATTAPGGGGGGAPVTTTPATTTVATTTTPTVTTMPPVTESETVESIGASETGSFAYETLPVTGIEVKVKNDVSDVKIEITKTDTAPATVAVAAPGQVHSYLDIEKQNIEDGDITSVKIKFKVEVSWIQNNDIDEKTIALYRYSNGKWNKLPTAEISRDSNYIYFEAKSPGLSVFAISGEKKVVTTVPPVTTKPKKPWVPIGIELSTMQIAGIIVGIVVISILVIFLFLRFQAVKMAT